MQHCVSCVLKFRNGNIDVCGLTGQQINPEEDFCSKYQYKREICGLCGQIIVGPGIIDSTRGTIICGKCMERLGSCAVCAKSRNCDFETNPSTLPKIVQQRVRQGSMTAVTQIRNPERVEITCKKNCSCYSANFGCLRENNCCGEYEEIKF